MIAPELDLLMDRKICADAQHKRLQHHPQCAGQGPEATGNVEARQIGVQMVEVGR